MMFTDFDVRLNQCTTGALASILNFWGGFCGYRILPSWHINWTVELNQEKREYLRKPLSFCRSTSENLETVNVEKHVDKTGKCTIITFFFFFDKVTLLMLSRKIGVLLGPRIRTYVRFNVVFCIIKIIERLISVFNDDYK